MVEAEAPVRPILRWAGSKRALLPVLARCAPPSFERYIEPFAGSACLFFALRPERSILGDTNAALIDMYRILQGDCEALSSRLSAMDDSGEEYYAVRALDPNLLSSLDKAARFIYLNRYCFNGVYRTNRSGQFNVPRGQRPGKMPDKEALRRASIALSGATLAATDFEILLADVRPGDFVYLDPPFSRSVRPHYGLYGYSGFTGTDVDRLSTLLDTIDKAGATFLLSYGGDDAAQLPSRWHSASVDVFRQVSGAPTGRRKATEMLLSNRKLPTQA